MMLVKEELLTYLTLGHVHVSRQDYQFFTNLTKINLEGNVTTGQDKLLNKLLDKYQRQLSKLGYDIEFLKELEWKKPLMETKDEYKKAYLSLKEENLIFKSPFSKKFINDLKSEVDHTFIWDKNQKVYISKASTFAFKTILNVAKKSFSDLIICDELKNKIDELKVFEGSIWNPTLKKVNESFYLIACNEPLLNAINGIPLNDDPTTLFKLSRYGIHFDSSIIKTETQKFASSYYYETDTEHLPNLIENLQILGIEVVQIESTSLYSNTLYKELRNKLLENGINVHSHNELKKLHTDECPILLSFRSRKYIARPHHLGKLVVIQNSQPVKIS